MERGRSRASTGTFIAPPPSSLARRVPPEPVDLPARRVTRSSTAAAQAADATGRIMPGADPHLSMVVRPATIHPSVTTRRVVTVSRPPPSPAATSTAARPIADRSRPTSTSSRPTSTSSRSTSTSSRSTAASSRSTTASSRSTATSSRPTATNSNSTATNSSSTAASSRSASTSSRLRTAGLAVAASSNLNTTDRPRGRTTTRAPISNLVRPTRKAVAKKKTKSAASPATVPSSDEENEDDCPVCFEENANIRWVALTACGHKFCQSCIKEFKKFPVENQLCPLCRAPCAADLRKPVKVGNVNC